MSLESASADGTSSQIHAARPARNPATRASTHRESRRASARARPSRVCADARDARRCTVASFFHY